ncbi:VOC family protein [Streptomyces sp. NPDC005438]|uniref:VOC family protein n=1 Tax=Streptomyces sp. NPDC005438 TaxID=3156880 RepID=UPI0033A62EC8
MASMIFVNLPVKDLAASTAFFEKLGYSKNPEFSDENASCVVFNDTVYAMLLTEPFFQGFSKKDIPDTARTAQMLLCLGAESRQQVDGLVDSAIAAGGKTHGETMEEGPMYGRSFTDLDGHIWEVVHMDMSQM